MIDICLVGGLGNQMFQTALYERFRSEGVPVKMFRLGDGAEKPVPGVLETFPGLALDPDEGAEDYRRLERLNEERSMPVRAAGRLLLSKRYVVEEEREGTFDPRIVALRDAALIGYWQTARYWAGLEDRIRDIFAFCRDFDADLVGILSRMSGEESVSVHIRGGDYRSEENRRIFGGICTPAYYRNAMDRMREMKKDPVFYIFTNDPSWARSVAGEDERCVFVRKQIGDNFPDWVDMMLMSRCRHNILANSSFSWWGAWLNGNPEKTVVAPARWLNTKKTKDIWEPGWIRVGGE